MDLVRLACVKHAASVRPEPGSNSPTRTRLVCTRNVRFESRVPDEGKLIVVAPSPALISICDRALSLGRLELTDNV